jgi:hypothetical protein
LVEAFFIGKGRSASNPNRPFRRTPKGFKRDEAMVIFFPVIIKELFVLGRKYPWRKPDSCPRCCSYRLWGHGYVPAYFDGYDQFFWLRRYRCPDCGCVVRMRPKGYFRRFQASIEVIHSSIESKACKGRWIFGISRTRQGHWFRSLCRRITAHLTDAWDQGFAAGFDRLCRMGQIPVSRGI